MLEKKLTNLLQIQDDMGTVLLSIGPVHPANKHTESVSTKGSFN